MQINFENKTNFSKGLNKRLFGCPKCQSSNYLVLAKSIMKRYYPSRELYCHFCNIVFSRIQAVSPTREC